jgi:hypothetical protein
MEKASLKFEVRKICQVLYKIAYYIILYITKILAYCAKDDCWPFSEQVNPELLFRQGRYCSLPATSSAAQLAGNAKQGLPKAH